MAVPVRFWYNRAMNARYESVDSIEPRELFPGAVARFIHSENMTVAFFSFDAGISLPEHSHPHEQITQVIEGSLLLTVGGAERRLLPGEVAIIPGGAVHSARTTEKTRVTDTFYPIREEYR